MSDFRHALKKAGYDQTEAYFHRKDLELIQKMRDASKKAEAPMPQEGGKIIPFDVSTDSTRVPERKKAA